MNEQVVKKIALVIAANCLFEEDKDEKLLLNIPENLQQKFNKQVTDRLYTFLLFLLNKPSNEYLTLMSELTKKYPDNWPLPDLDPSFIKIFNDASHSGNII